MHVRLLIISKLKYFTGDCSWIGASFFPGSAGFHTDHLFDRSITKIAHALGRAFANFTKKMY